MDDLGATPIYGNRHMYTDISPNSQILANTEIAQKLNLFLEGWSHSF